MVIEKTRLSNFASKGLSFAISGIAFADYLIIAYFLAG